MPGRYFLSSPPYMCGYSASASPAHPLVHWHKWALQIISAESSGVVLLVREAWEVATTE